MTSVDLVVVGAGIVGLAHALHALDRGLSVAVVERDGHAVGASVRNFGHGCVTAQDGEAFEYATAAQDTWLRLAKEAGFWIREAGTLVVARAEDELAVLEEFASFRDVRLLPGVPFNGIGGALLPQDFRVDPRQAVHAIAKHLRDRGAVFHWSTTAHTIEPGLVRTSTGVLEARKVIVAVGH